VKILRNSAAGAVAVFLLLLMSPTIASADAASISTPTVVSIGSQAPEVSWTTSLDVSTITSYDVVTYDTAGVVVSTDSADASATSFTLPSTPAGTGYTVVIVAHTADGDVSSLASDPFDVTSVEPLIPGGVQPGTHVTVDPTTATVTANTDGSGWTIAWLEADTAGASGEYSVLTSDGSSCMAASTGVTGAAISCTVDLLADSTQAPTVSSIEFNSFVIAYSMAGGGTNPFSVQRDKVLKEVTATPKVTPVLVESKPATVRAIVQKSASGPLMPKRNPAIPLSGVAACLALAGMLVAASWRLFQRS
jgi:hypothetical protein